MRLKIKNILIEQGAGMSLMIIDTLNQVLLRINEDESLGHWCKKIKERISIIKKKARQMDLIPIFVVDGTLSSSEVKEKWFERREKELKKGIKKVPYAANTIICELLVNNKSLVIHDRKYDADDVIATMLFNSFPRSIILSRDTDFFRYENLIHSQIYALAEDYSLENCKMQKNGHKKKRQTLKKYVPYFVNLCTTITTNSLFFTENKYFRGVVYPQAEHIGFKNLHMAGRDLRRCLYEQRTHEKFPYIENGMIKWVDEMITPNDRYKHIVDSDFNTIKHFLENKIGGIMNLRHEDAIRTMCAEILAIKNKSSLGVYLFHDWYNVLR